MQKIKLGISSCLLGNSVRYDGGHKLDPFLKETLGIYIDWVSVCPEVEYGLQVPREAMNLVRKAEGTRLVTSVSGIDHTDGMRRWAVGRLDEIEKEDICGFIFKSGSPSSGLRGVKAYDDSGVQAGTDTGVFAGTFIERFPLMPVEDNDHLQAPSLRENFIERVFVFKRWKEFLDGGAKIKDLISFHTDHKLIILAHSTRHYRMLGGIVANAKDYRSEKLHLEYFQTLMEGLKLLSTVKKNTNVLHHILGYFKRVLSPDEKKEVFEVIKDYHRGLLPLIVPVTLLAHHVRKYDERYLARQHYFFRHPLELMLRNHA